MGLIEDMKKIKGRLNLSAAAPKPAIKIHGIDHYYIPSEAFDVYGTGGFSGLYVSKRLDPFIFGSALSQKADDGLSSWCASKMIAGSVGERIPASFEWLNARKYVAAHKKQFPDLWQDFSHGRPEWVDLLLDFDAADKSFAPWTVDVVAIESAPVASNNNDYEIGQGTKDKFFFGPRTPGRIKSWNYSSGYPDVIPESDRHRALYEVEPSKIRAVSLSVGKYDSIPSFSAVADPEDTTHRRDYRLVLDEGLAA